MVRKCLDDFKETKRGIEGTNVRFEETKGTNGGVEETKGWVDETKRELRKRKDGLMKRKEKLKNKRNG
jgi:hypothetical protein